LSSLVEFEDLALLDGGDLRAVFGQIDADQVVEALSGAPAWLRQRLLASLPASMAGPIEAELLARGPIAPEIVVRAQHAAIDALCRLSRGGYIAFDDPEDLFPESLVA
jgi:flagellar motor switch protein FliG